MASAKANRTTTIIAADGRAVSVQIRRATLVVADGPQAELNRRTLDIGAHPSNDLVISADRGVSGFHCRITVDDKGYRVSDRDSANGTFIDDVRIVDAYLAPGQRLRLGRTDLSIRAHDEPLAIELSENDFFGEVVGRSILMRELFAVAERAAKTTATILLEGETGTGKDVLARAIHQNSPRSSKPLIVFDCGAVSPNLIESALFGHVQGAFTGAIGDSAGVFERANGGTVFLDEIGELDGPLQPKLLRVLENGTLSRVGGASEIVVDVRIIAATNRDLASEVEAGRFRSDLFYRLAVVPLHVPALRQRKDDIPLLASHFLRHILDRDGSESTLLKAHMDAAFSRLTDYGWPGNVRELRNVIERAAVLSDPQELEKDIFSRLVELKKTIGVSMHRRSPLKVAREQFDVEYLRDVLDAAGGDVAKAADIADVHPKSFARLLRRYSIKREVS